MDNNINKNNYENQKAELFKHIWKIADELRGKVDGWDFKNYILSFLFYRYISDNITDYFNKNEIEAGIVDFNYENLSDDQITEQLKEDTINEKGFFIYPSELFNNFYQLAKENRQDLNEHIDRILKNIENSAMGTKGEGNIKGIFSGTDFNSSNLGPTVPSRNENIYKIISKIKSLNLGNFKDKTIDIFGDAYEYLMSMYASSAGKSGGEYFTPQEVSKLLTKLAIRDKKTVNKVYDPACGSGSLLLQSEKILGHENVIGGFFGQDSNPTTYNLCRMNMFLHNVGFDKFDIRCEDTLVNPQHSLEQKYDVIVSNPPYSIKWEGKNNPVLINDERYSPAGVLAPSSKADFAFILHSLYLLDINGYASIVCFPGIFYRTGAEQQIRKYLIDNNYIDLIISLAPNLFYGTSINVNIMVLSKSKKDNKTMFIDATKLFEKATNQNRLTDNNINQIVDTYLNRKEILHFSKLVDYEQIEANNYDLSVSNYVEVEEIKEVIDIKVLNEEINKTVDNINSLRDEINKIIKELE